MPTLAVPLRNRYFLAADVLLIVVAAYGAFATRLEWSFPNDRVGFAFYATSALLLKPPVFLAFGLYSRIWRYASATDLKQVLLGVTAAAVVMSVATSAAILLGLVPWFARSIVFLDWLLTLALVGGIRLSARALTDVRHRPGMRAPAVGRRVLVVGAGDAGAVVVREMQRNPQLGLVPVGFLDDEPAKLQKRVYGVPVVGTLGDLASCVDAAGADEVIIAIPTAPGTLVRRVLETCHGAQVPARVIPGIFELLDGQVSVGRARDVDITDLLRRSPVSGERDTGPLLAGRCALVTGAGGSIGAELCRQVAAGRPSDLVLLGHGENSLFDCANDLRSLAPGVRLHTVVADVRDAGRIGRVFARFRPDVVFHAAAHKHVGLMEENPEEAITNNVFGTRHVVDAAIEHGTERFVLISTDKAVDPTSVMGASKAMAEQVVQLAALTHRRPYCAVRFGNVLGSRGSVVPIFKKQIEQGGPITVTHPEVRRYFMTIPEAVHLVLQAATLAKGGETFVLDMGEPVRIVDLARDLLRLSGLSEERVPIVFTGLKDGEKLDETLCESGARLELSEHDRILVLRSARTPAVEELTSCLAAFQHAIGTGAGDSELSNMLLAALSRKASDGRTAAPPSGAEAFRVKAPPAD